MNRLVDAFRAGTIDEGLLRKLQINDADTFKIQDSFGIRPNPVKEALAIDVPFLRRTVRNLQASKRAGNRVGHTWQPAKSTVMTENEDNSFSYDDLAVLNSVCTKWCTRTYFPDSFTRVSFIFNVFALYTALADAYRDVEFDIVFKGGVIMRLLIMEFVSEFPMRERVDAERYLQENKALSFSDFDFEIVPRNHALPEESTLRLVHLDYTILMWLRSMMDRFSARRAKNPLFDLSWDESEAVDDLRSMLQKEIDGLDKDHPLHRATVDRVIKGCHDKHPPKGYRTRSGRATHGKRDNAVIFQTKGEADRSVISARDFLAEMGLSGVPCEHPVDFYCTLNTFIGEDTVRNQEAQLRTTFHLSRIKQGFVVYLTTRDGQKHCERLGGEIIDLSQSHGTRVDEMRRYLYSRVKEPYRLYYIMGSQFHVRSYSANGILHDLRMQIHFQERPPFNDMDGTSKVRKRLLRYVLFLTVYVMGPFVMHPFAKKVRALAVLTRTTSSLEHLYKYRRCNIDPIDEFVHQEQRTLRLEGSVKKKQRYLSALHRHLNMVTALLSSEHRSNETSMDDRYLEFADAFMY